MLRHPGCNRTEYIRPAIHDGAHGRINQWFTGQSIPRKVHVGPSFGITKRTRVMKLRRQQRVFIVELLRKLGNISELGEYPRRMIQIGFEPEFFSVSLSSLVVTKSNRLSDCLSISGKSFGCDLVRPTKDTSWSVTGEIDIKGVGYRDVRYPRLHRS